ncbi:MAG: RES family NAD+ phosphorylase [Hyphomicrobiales bacterium]
MPIVWRVTKAESAKQLDGADNSERGGRWNSPGRGVLYAAENLALAALECFANMSREQRLKMPEMAAVGIEIPDHEALLISREEVEQRCNGNGGEQWCRSIGDRWLDEARHLALIAPSVIVPREKNIVLNPAHPAMGEVKIAVLEPYTFDERLIHADNE